MITHDSPIVEIRVGAELLRRFTVLLQNGVDIVTPCNCTIAQFLDRLPGFSLDYIEKRVQTIFLNGSAMDDLATPITGKNPVLAISAAMPGLAGAIFRRGSIHAALRSKSAAASGETDADKTMSVRLKLFNMIATEKGEELLARGVGIASSTLKAFLSDHPSLLSSIGLALISGETISSASLMQQLPKTENIHLIIKKDDDEISP